MQPCYAENEHFPYKSTSTQTSNVVRNPEASEVAVWKWLSLTLSWLFPHPAMGTHLVCDGSCVSPKTLLCTPGWPQTQISSASASVTLG